MLWCFVCFQEPGDEHQTSLDQQSQLLEPTSPIPEAFYDPFASALGHIPESPTTTRLLAKFHSPLKLGRELHTPPKVDVYATPSTSRMRRFGNPPDNVAYGPSRPHVAKQLQTPEDRLLLMNNVVTGQGHDDALLAEISMQNEYFENNLATIMTSHMKGPVLGCTSLKIKSSVIEKSFISQRQHRVSKKEDGAQQTGLVSMPFTKQDFKDHMGICGFIACKNTIDTVDVVAGSISDADSTCFQERQQAAELCGDDTLLQQSEVCKKRKLPQQNDKQQDAWQVYEFDPAASVLKAHRVGSRINARANAGKHNSIGSRSGTTGNAGQRGGGNKTKCPELLAMFLTRLSNKKVVPIEGRDVDFFTKGEGDVTFIDKENFITLLHDNTHFFPFADMLYNEEIVPDLWKMLIAGKRYEHPRHQTITAKTSAKIVLLYDWLHKEYENGNVMIGKNRA